MPRKTWPFISTLICFACLLAFIALNDINYRGESMYRDIQIKTFAAYSDWNVYIGTLRGALLSTNGLGGILDEAVAQKGKVAVLLADLRNSSAGTEPRTRRALEAFVGSIEAGLAAGQDIIDQGRVLLQRPDLPLAYREGRLGLSSLSGKDASSVLGEAAAYQYFQLVGSLEGMDVLFDQLFYDRLESIMSSVGDAAKSAQSAFFVLRLVFLAVLAMVFAATVIGLFGVNRSLRGLADRTSRELDTARGHLSEVQGFLHSAQYRQSLFDMVAGISHELNTPLGNCVALSSHLEDRILSLRAAALEGSISRENLDAWFLEGLESLEVMQGSLDQMRLQIETFKGLSTASSRDSSDSVVELGDYLDRELPRLAAERAPGVEVVVDWEAGSKSSVHFTEMEQILGQLLANSKEHGGASKVSILFRAEKGFLVMRFSDDGSGVPEERLGRLAEPFYTTARGRSHMGLGLAIVASLVANKLQGSISFGRGGPGLVVTIRAEIGEN